MQHASNFLLLLFPLGQAVANLVEVLHYNPVAGSILDGVTENFYWHNPSDRTMALGPTQPLTEMSTRHISWGENFMCRHPWNLGASASSLLSDCLTSAFIISSDSSQLLVTYSVPLSPVKSSHPSSLVLPSCLPLLSFTVPQFAFFSSFSYQPQSLYSPYFSLIHFFFSSLYAILLLALFSVKRCIS